jgi:hypothetical protein
MERIAVFLELDWDDTLLRQTIMGHPTEPNSSFQGTHRPIFQPRTIQERAWLKTAVLTAKMIRTQNSPAG